MEQDCESFCGQTAHRDIQIVPRKTPSRPVAQTPATDRSLWGRLTKIPSLGIILGVLSSFSFSVAIMLVKVIKDVDPMFFVMARGILQVFLFNSVGIYQRLRLETFKSKSMLLYLVLTGILGSVAQVLAYGSLAFIPLGDATAIILSAPVFVGLFACILLKEKCGAFQVLTVIIAVLGVFLICRPTFIFGSDQDLQGSPTDHIIGTSMVAAGCISLAGVYVTLRKISYVPMAITNSSLGVCSILMGFTMMIIKNQWHLPVCGLQSTLLVVSACSGTIGMLLFVCATKMEDAGPLSVVRTSEILFAFVWQMGLLGHIPSWTTLAGAGAIVSSVVLTAMQKWASKNNLCFGAEICAVGKRARKKDCQETQEQMPMRDASNLDGARC